MKTGTASTRIAAITISFALGLANASAMAADKLNEISIGNRFEIESKILGESRPYWVHKPAGYDVEERPYPVLILLDGDTHFAHTSAAVDFLSQSGRIPQLLVVGIPNTNRERDLSTPITTAGATVTNPDGAKNFLAFIGDELLPEIDKRYRTRPYRVIVGHSLGGLFAIYSLTERPQLFNAYIPISPSLWWDKQTLVKNAETFLTSHSDLRADIYMTIGNEDKEMLGGFWKLSALFEEKGSRHLRWQIKRAPDETHNSNPYLSTYNGLQAIFEGWYVHDPLPMYEQGGLAAVAKHYADVGTRLGYKVPVPTQIYVSLLRSLNTLKRYDDAEALLEHAISDYPNSAQAKFELARVYQSKNDAVRANEMLIKVLTLYPGSQQARMMLAANKIDVATVVPDLKLPNKELEAFAGEYRNDFDSATIVLKDGKLVSTASNGGVCELRPLSAAKFYCVNTDVEVTFTRDKRNRVTSALVQFPEYKFERKKVK